MTDEKNHIPYTSAFPSSDERFIDPDPGMSLRDYFAARAMEGMITSWSGDNIEHIPTVAKKAYHFADAMMKARGEA